MSPKAYNILKWFIAGLLALGLLFPELAKAEKHQIGSPITVQFGATVDNSVFLKVMPLDQIPPEIVDKYTQVGNNGVYVSEDGAYIQQNTDGSIEVVY